VDGDRALYFEKENPKDLAEKLRHLQDDPAQIEELGRKSAGRANGLYDWDKIIDSYER